MSSPDPLRTRICDLLECAHPIVQAGMGGVARAELAAAVSAAGGYGLLGMVRESPSLIAAQIDEVRARTDRPFGVNLIPAATDPGLFEEELAVCIEKDVHSLCFFWDVNEAAVARVKASGRRLLHQVGSRAQAMLAERAGADVVIAQGLEAGGHVHGSVSSLVLLPEIVEAVGIPVLASGGFASGASLVAALALGAEGIHCGTVFLASEESFAHEFHKSRVRAAQSEDTVYTDAFALNWPPDSPVRVLTNSVTRELGERLFGTRPGEIPLVEIGREGERPIYRQSTDSPLRHTRGDLEAMALFAGQVAGHVSQELRAEAVLERIVREAKGTLDRLTSPG